MTIAIETRFLGQTDTKPARIVATTVRGQRCVISYPCGANGVVAHSLAAASLADSIGCMSEGERLVGGEVQRGYVFLLIGRARQ